MASWNLDPDVVHLNHGAFGACPVEVLDHQAELRAQLEANPVKFVLRTYQPLLERSRDALAGFVGADRDGLVFVPNATYGVNSVLRSLEPQLGAGDEIVITTHTYEACQSAVRVIAERTGAAVVVADIPFPIAGPHQAIDGVLASVSERTKLVLLDHVTSPTALVMPIAEIAAALDPSIMVLVDGAHAPGMIDVDIVALGVDFYTANCHKWICSPKGAAFLWVGAAHRDAMISASVSLGHDGGWPRSTSPFHARFDWTGTDDPTARLSVACAIEVMGNHHPDGWDGVRSTNHALAIAGRQILLDAFDIMAPAPDSMIGSIASVPLPPGEPNPSSERALSTALQEDFSIEVPSFAWPEAPDHFLRISAQQYNSIDEYHTLARGLMSLRD
ncbi:MAG: aminotransferase class V-fold PLP-dependent enzyme [Actinomycetota bacterium]